VSEELPYEIQLKQDSCKNCLRCKAGLFERDTTRWYCYAPENMLDTIDQVTGEHDHKFVNCASARFAFADKCPWQKPERIYQANGSSKTIWEIQKTQNPQLTSRLLSRTTLDDI
jgi:hypothetical protein